MLASLTAFAVVGAALIAFGARLGRRAFVVAALPPAATTVWLATRLPAVSEGQIISERFRWVGDLGLDVEFRLDGFAVTMSLIIVAVGVAVLAYAAHYFAPDARDLGRLAGLLVLFGGSMLCLVQADHMLVLYTGWELTSITSFLLIGNRHTESRARAAALHALLVTGAGGLALLGGLVILGQEAGSYRISEVLRNPPADSAAITGAMVLLLVGAFTKSAQYPFHAWLPGAMAAPTPVSAYLHSATMVKAGVFLVARLAPMFAATDVWRPLVLTVGSCTLVFGGLRALRQHDLKLLLAFGTVSQLGLLMVLFGAGTPATATAGWALLIAHAAFKATLFLVVGIIDHQTGTRDIRVLPPLSARWRPVELVTLLAAASMAGVPLGAGFVAKELAYDALGDAPFAGHALVLAVAVVGSMLTVAYAARFYWGAFPGPRRRAGERATESPAPPSAGFLAPAAVLAVVGVVLGAVPGLADRLATAAVTGLGGVVAPVRLTLWHGFGIPLALSMLTLTGGALLAVGDRWVQPRLAWGGGVPSGAEVYLATLRSLGVVSARVTGFVQNGSLPVYAGVIVGTAALVTGGALLGGQVWAGWPGLGPLSEAPVVLTLLVAALGAAVVRRRFSAAVFLGVTGYSMAGLFVLSGAPDLALTQAAVETLTTVVFVLVLRRLPERFERQSTPGRRAVRLAVAASVGAAIFVFALVAAGYRLAPPVSEEMVARSLPDGHGRNVVNVILVDFRGFDTLGEITVLAAAAIGAVALARVGRRAAEGRGDQRSPGALARRLAFVDVSVRVVFHAVLMTSLWLLFAGHNQPGGGFVGGLLAGSAIALRYIAGGIDEVRGRSRFRPWTVLGAGLLLAAITATVPVFAGGSVLEVGLVSLDLPVLGAVKISSALAFDTGVYLAVVGMVLMVFEAFGEDPAEAAA
ncbi:MAG TPA: hydrogen gas-evolving membrane-bound hydrogenase subunit E [Acidimicrobiia bacterium]|nr:hydrogen gas-evolving membrane-bound hydrogenase subunit E [Acidimicrobiia bacterium]